MRALCCTCSIRCLMIPVQCENIAASVDESKPLSNKIRNGLRSDHSQWACPDDIEAASSNICNNSSAAHLLIEHTWAVSLQEAIMNTSGIPLAGGLVAPTVVQLLEAELAASAAR